jgi:hypothetical protein
LFEIPGSAYSYFICKPVDMHEKIPYPHYLDDHNPFLCYQLKPTFA